jgi:hypothetical protein
VVADGAVAYWRLGETSGTTAVDVIGGANGTISGGVTLGQAGALADGDKAMGFNGTATGKIVTPSLTLPSPSTIELWIKTTSAPSDHALVSNRSGAASANEVFVGLTVGQPDVYSGAGFVGVDSRRVDDGQFHHVVYVMSGTAVTFYVDGVAGTTVAHARTAFAAPIGIGAEPSGGLPVNGLIDDVAIYPTALTAPQIAAHYAARTFTDSLGSRFSHRYRYAA